MGSEQSVKPKYDDRSKQEHLEEPIHKSWLSKLIGDLIVGAADHHIAHTEPAPRQTKASDISSAGCTNKTL